jgi:hypothetical protein
MNDKIKKKSNFISFLNTISTTTLYKAIMSIYMFYVSLSLSFFFDFLIYHHCEALINVQIMNG